MHPAHSWSGNWTIALVKTSTGTVGEHSGTFRANDEGLAQRRAGIPLTKKQPVAGH
jgi:hypothetical protein